MDGALDEIERAVEVVRSGDGTDELCEWVFECDPDTLLNGWNLLEELTHLRVRCLAAAGDDELSAATRGLIGYLGDRARQFVVDCGRPAGRDAPSLVADGILDELSDTAC